MKFKSLLLMLAISGMVFTSCEKEDPDIPNEEEVITTLTYTLTPSGGGTAVVLSFQDLDGDGGDDPIITDGTLAANTTYEGALVLSNEQESPAEDITVEILDEDEEHQFFFTTTVTGLAISYADQDGAGNPLGLSSSLTTTDAGSGTMTIILRHEPNKSASGVSDGDIANAGGETDIEVSFNVTVL